MWSKGHDVTTRNGEVPYGPLSKSCFSCPHLITVVPVTRDKGYLSKSYDYEVMMSLPPEVNWTLQWGLPAVQVWCFYDWRYIGFQTGHFAAFKHFKIDSSLSEFRQVKMDPKCSI